MGVLPILACRQIMSFIVSGLLLDLIAETVKNKLMEPNVKQTMWDV